MPRHKSMHSLLFVVLLSAAGARGGEERLPLPTLTVIDKGIFAANDMPDIPATHALWIGSGAPRGVTFVRSATTISAQAGTVFGFSYTIPGMSKGSRTPLTLVLDSPGGGSGLLDFGGRTVVHGEIEGGAVNFFGYGLDDDATPGIWTLEIRSGSLPLAHETFTVTK